MNVEPFGGFEDWSEQVREGLVWLGEADPVDTVQLVQDTDPETEALEEVVDYWKNKLGVGVGYKTHEILERATNIPDFYSALINAPATGAILTRGGWAIGCAFGRVVW